MILIRDEWQTHPPIEDEELLAADHQVLCFDVPVCYPGNCVGMKHPRNQLGEIVPCEMFLQTTVGQKKVEQGLATEIFKLNDMDVSVGERPSMGDNAGVRTQQVEDPEFRLEGFKVIGELQGNLGWVKRSCLFFGMDHRPILTMTKLFEKPIGPSLEEADVLDGQVEWHLLESLKKKGRCRRENGPDPNLQLINSEGNT